MATEDDNKPRAAAALCEEDDGMFAAAAAAWLVVDDDTAAELSKLLDMFDAAPPPARVRFSADPYSSPAAVVQSSSAYVTINGNEESCGSSFSDSDSSVMASVDFGGAWRFRFEAAREDGFVMMDGCDRRDGGGGDEDDDDAMWVEFLNEVLG